MVDPVAQLRLELDQVFAGHDAMAQAMTIDGVSVLVVAQATQAEEVQGAGVYQRQLRLLLRSADLRMPRVGQKLVVDDIVWTVAETHELAGVLDLVLWRPES